MTLSVASEHTPSYPTSSIQAKDLFAVASLEQYARLAQPTAELCVL